MTKNAAGKSRNSLVPEFPLGHLGHLSPGQEEALEQFKARLEEQALWKRGPPASHDDGTLLRFLRARRWVPDDAVEQFRSSEEWFAAAGIETLRQTLDVEDWKQSYASVANFLGRLDRRGNPIFHVDLGSVDEKAWSENGQPKAIRDFAKARSGQDMSATMMTISLQLDLLFRVVAPMCTRVVQREHLEVPVTMCTIVADISCLSLRRFWSLKNHIYCLFTGISTIFPETASHIFIVCAPSYVSIMWNWIKSWLDPVTASKVQILKTNEVKQALETYIEPRNIPVKYGGTLADGYGPRPPLEPNLRGIADWEPGFDTLPHGALTLEDDGDDGERLACFTCGTENGQPRRQKVFTMPKETAKPRARDEGTQERASVMSTVDEKQVTTCVTEITEVTASAAA